MNQAPTGGAGIPGTYVHLKKNTIHNIALLFLIVGIAFSEEIPIELRRFANTFWGGVVGLIGVWVAYTYFDWTTALLVALLYVLAANSSIISLTENFEPGIDTRFVANRRKWYIEQVLGENPLLIEEDTVKTIAVQDDNNEISRDGLMSGSNM